MRPQTLPRGLRKYPYIYCAWLWVWSAFYIMGWVQVSPLVSLIAASVFILVVVGCTSIYHKAHWTKRVFIFVLESFVAVIVGVLGQKGNVWTRRAAAYNIGLFVVYLMFLRARNLSFSRVYFDLLPRRHTKDPNETVLDYVEGMFYISSNQI